MVILNPTALYHKKTLEFWVTKSDDKLKTKNSLLVFPSSLETSWIIKGSVPVWFIIWQRTKWEKLSNEYEYVIVKLYQLGKLSQLDKLDQKVGKKNVII